MAPAGFEPAILVGERPQTHALDYAATGTGEIKFNYVIWGPHIRVQVEVCWDDVIQIGKKLTMLRWKLPPTFRAVQKLCPEVGGNKLHRNVGNNSPVYTVLYPRSLVYSVYQDFTRYSDLYQDYGLLVVLWRGLVDNYQPFEETGYFRLQNIKLDVNTEEAIASETSDTYVRRYTASHCGRL